MSGFKPRRFDVAGVHPDEAWRAVSNMAETVKELGAQAGAEIVSRKFLTEKPLRFADPRDADVQGFLERGVKMIDALGAKRPLGLSRGQQEVRDRGDELAKSMRKVLDRRPDEGLPFDPWRAVRIRVEAVNGGLSAGETRGRYVQALKGCFPRGPAQAARARIQYVIWEQNAERFHKDGPMNEAAQSWKRFMGVVDNMKSREQAKGITWGRADIDKIDFKPALQQQAQYKPKMRM